SSGADAMIYRPEETISELSTILDLHPGDLVLTGTPSGVAMQAPSALVQRLAAIFLSPGARNRLFVKKQLDRSQYLKDGDLVESTIRTRDGALDLGSQRHLVQ
ncbi:MAG: fumarylacetoacetate hydrolase family protein, partial [Leptospiraceae bacterium]|nr:fumarylacetoacetate hydrolase family protein [Leptospiraceae bacterium]